MRLTVHQLRAAGLFETVGVCASNLSSLLALLNDAVQRLILAGGETGWYGTWASMAFNVDPANPYITTPREVARLINVDVCRFPIRVQNGFYEFLQFGHGLQKQSDSRCCSYMEAYDRGNFPTGTDLPAGSKIRVYWTNVGDDKKRVFLIGTDTNNLPISGLDNGVQVNGFFLTLNNTVAFTDSSYLLNSLTGITKDVTFGPVNIYAVNPTTGVQTFLAALAPSERTPSYRRYFLQGLPNQCLDCDATAGVVQVQAMAKLEFVPMTCDSDFCIIGNLPALAEEIQACRLRKMDSPKALAEAREHHQDAIRLLNQELIHYLGKEQPAINFSPFGPADLACTNLGMM